MQNITKIIRIENKKTYANVFVRLDDGSEAVVYIGGQVKVWFDDKYGKIKAHVKWKGLHLYMLGVDCNSEVELW